MTAALTVRAATPEDLDRILEWANDSAARAASFNPRAILPEENQRWFAARLADPATGRIWIGFLGEVPIGVVRFERAADGPLIVSISVDQAVRGCRLSRPLLDVGLIAAREAFTGARFRAWIRPESGPSLALFRGAGFAPPAEPPSLSPVGAGGDAVVLELD